jgi:hypothetical protein
MRKIRIRHSKVKVRISLLGTDRLRGHITIRTPRGTFGGTMFDDAAREILFCLGWRLPFNLYFRRNHTAVRVQSSLHAIKQHHDDFLREELLEH